MKLYVAIVASLFACVSAAPVDEADVRVLSSDFDRDDSGNYRYSFELDNGNKQEVEGSFIAGDEPETGVLRVGGSNEFVGDDGNTYQLSFTADEEGFKPQGAHLPVAPEQIPEYAQLRADHPELFWAEQK